MYQGKEANEQLGVPSQAVERGAAQVGKALKPLAGLAAHHKAHLGREHERGAVTADPGESLPVPEEVPKVDICSQSDTNGDRDEGTTVEK